MKIYVSETPELIRSCSFIIETIPEILLCGNPASLYYDITYGWGNEQYGQD